MKQMLWCCVLTYATSYTMNTTSWSARVKNDKQPTKKEFFSLVHEQQAYKNKKDKKSHTLLKHEMKNVWKYLISKSFLYERKFSRNYFSSCSSKEVKKKTYEFDPVTDVYIDRLTRQPYDMLVGVYGSERTQTELMKFLHDRSLLLHYIQTYLALIAKGEKDPGNIRPYLREQWLQKVNQPALITKMQASQDYISRGNMHHQDSRETIKIEQKTSSKESDIDDLIQIMRDQKNIKKVTSSSFVSD